MDTHFEIIPVELPEPEIQPLEDKSKEVLKSINETDKQSLKNYIDKLIKYYEERIDELSTRQSNIRKNIQKIDQKYQQFKSELLELIKINVSDKTTLEKLSNEFEVFKNPIKLKPEFKELAYNYTCSLNTLNSLNESINTITQYIETLNLIKMEL